MYNKNSKSFIANSIVILTLFINITGCDETAQEDDSGKDQTQSPAISLTADPTVVGPNGSTSLTWSSTDATSCTASGDWSGNKGTSGTEAISQLQTDSIFNLTCTGDGGSVSTSVSVTVSSQPIPTVDLSANPASVSLNGTTTLIWDSSNTDSCTASGGWSGNKTTSGQETIDSLTESSTYNLSCTGPGGTAEDSVSVTVDSLALTVNLSANPTTVSTGGSTTLSWESSNAGSCTASGGWSGNKTTSGQETVDSLTESSTFNLSCTGTEGTAQDSVSVIVNSTALTVNLSADPTTVSTDGSTTLSWESSNADSCTASGDWSGSKGLSGTETIDGLSVDSRFILTCSDANESVSDTIDVTVTPASENPQVTNPAVTVTSNSLTIEAESDSRTISVTFGFDGDVQVGQFVDGSYFVTPVAGSSEVTIASLQAVGGSVRADENPVYNKQGLTDGTKAYGNHDSSETLSFPLTRSNATSIVAAIQKDEATYGNCGTSAIVGECIDAIFTLTVLPSVPPANALRPALSTADKAILTLDDFDLSEIPHVAFFDGPSDTASILREQKRWTRQTEILSVLTLTGSVYSEGGRAWRSDIYGGNYGSSTARSLSTAWTWVMSADLSNPDQYAMYEGLIAALLVYGQDLYNALYDGNNRIAGWGAGAGQSHGKLIPVSIYATLKRDNSEEYANLSKLISQVGEGNAQIPSELEQINAGANGPIWGDGPDPQFITRYNLGAYWGSMLKHQCFDGATGSCSSTSGKKTLADPHRYIDGPETAGTNYYSVSFGPNQAFAAMMILFPEIRAMINSTAIGDYSAYRDAPIKFANRVVTEGLLTSQDPCAPPDPREDVDNCDAYRSRNCLYYGLSNTGTATWGPDPADTDWTDGIECIHNNTGGNSGQNGRFTSRHGYILPDGGGYKTTNISNNWMMIYDLYSE